MFVTPEQWPHHLIGKRFGMVKSRNLHELAARAQKLGANAVIAVGHSIGSFHGVTTSYIGMAVELDEDLEGNKDLPQMKLEN